MARYFFRYAALLCVAAVLLLSPAARGVRAQTPSSGQALPRDTIAVTMRTPPAEALQPYRNDPAFDYDRTGATGPSWWSTFWQWLGDRVVAGLQVPGVRLVIRILFYVLLAVTLGLALRGLLRMQRKTAFERRETHQPVEMSMGRDAIETTDFEALVREAVEAAAYRRAVRLLYLQLLQTCIQKGQIDWQPDKTNEDYLDDVRDTPLYPLFARATDLFAHVWYGDAALDRETFDRVRPVFEAVRARLSASEHAPSA